VLRTRRPGHGTFFSFETDTPLEGVQMTAELKIIVAYLVTALAVVGVIAAV
jgi:hypothetical protein